MLASQFLSVVIDEGDTEIPAGDKGIAEETVNVEANRHKPESVTSNSSVEGNGSDESIIQDLEAFCKLPKVLLAECTIKLASPEDKARLLNRECRFEACITPIHKPKPRLQVVQLSRLQGRHLQKYENKSPSPPQNIEDLLQGVEAVYSDEEEGEGSGVNNVYKKRRCAGCRRSFLRRCLSSRLGNKTDEYIPRGFPCNVCGKVFSQRSVLKKHETIHSGYRLRCKVCGIDFTQRSSLLRHCKRIHGIASDHEIQIPLVPPDLRPFKPRVVSTSPQKLLIPGLADRLNALLNKKEDSITLAVTKKKDRIGPYSVDPHTVMTITPDVIIQTSDIDD